MSVGMLFSLWDLLAPTLPIPTQSHSLLPAFPFIGQYNRILFMSQCVGSFEPRLLFPRYKKCYVTAQKFLLKAQTNCNLQNRFSFFKLNSGRPTVCNSFNFEYKFTGHRIILLQVKFIKIEFANTKACFNYKVVLQ